MKRGVILGPTNELHAGIHGSLLENPPRGFGYLRRSASHIFLFPRGVRLLEPPSPHRYQHWGEFLDFGLGPELVHSSRFPVLRRRAWIVDMDDFGYPVVAGRSMWNPRLRRRHGGPWTPEYRENVKRRVRSMLTAYAHPSCKAIFFCTKAGLESARGWLRLLRAGPLGEVFLEKSRLLYPAQRPVSKNEVLKKWRNPGRLGVLFCGNDYWVKNGRLALRIFSRLAPRFPRVRFTYVGMVPEKERMRHQEMLQRIDYHPTIPRKEVLSYFKRSHILFHPTKNESFGMVYLEAAAAGQAVITAEGGRMGFVREIFTGGSLFVDRAITPESQEEREFEVLLRTLLENPEQARVMGMENYEMTTSGPFSIERRNRLLREAYEEAEGRPARTGLSLSELPDWKRSVPLTMESELITFDINRYREEIGFEGFNLYL